MAGGGRLPPIPILGIILASSRKESKMRLTLHLPLLLLGIALPLTPGFAQSPSDGNALLHNCSLVTKMADGDPVTSVVDNLNAGVCMGLVRGIMDTMTLWQSLDHGGPVDNTAIHGCIPDSIKTIQGARIVVKYLNDHPEKLQVPDTRLVLMAMVDAFPCSKESR